MRACTHYAERIERSVGRGSGRNARIKKSNFRSCGTTRVISTFNGNIINRYIQWPGPQHRGNKGETRSGSLRYERYNAVTPRRIKDSSATLCDKSPLDSRETE